MISQGTDVLLRGNMLSGVVQGDNFLKFLRFNKTALERHKDIRKRIKLWLENPDKWIFANTEDWFDGIFLDPKGKWIWIPPPCLDRLALEQFCKVKDIFPNSQYVFVCPESMTGYWRKILGKIMDTIFTFKASCCVWYESMYEPLTVAFVKPFLLSSPWKVRFLPAVNRWGKQLFQMQWNGSQQFQNHMHKFWH